MINKIVLVFVVVLTLANLALLARLDWEVENGGVLFGEVRLKSGTIVFKVDTMETLGRDKWFVTFKTE